MATREVWSIVTALDRFCTCVAGSNLGARDLGGRKVFL